MDDRTSSSATTLAFAFAGCLLLVLPARAAFGERGVEVVLAVALLLLTACAYVRLTGRALGRPLGGPLGWPPLRPRPVQAEPAAVVEDVWRSERWIREAVQRGLRAVDEWRLEQSEA